MAQPRVAINGLGRIGRLAFRLLLDANKVNLVAVNDIAPNENLAYLLKYDTAQRKWERNISFDAQHLIVDGKAIPCLAEKNPSDLPWQDLDVDIVIECTGYFRSEDKASLHLTAGAKKVLVSAPASGDVKTIVLGVNDELLSADDKIVSNASCTTNCLAPMLKVLDELAEIENAYITTVHSYTGNQRLQDTSHPADMRRGRAAAINIVPTTTSATSTVEKVLPHMKGKLAGGAVRVPIITGSLTELYANVKKDVTVEQINEAFQQAAESNLKGVVEYTEDPIVSWDVVHNPHSCIFDAGLTTVMQKHIKIVAWYDNEFGYANRLVDVLMKIIEL